MSVWRLPSRALPTLVLGVALIVGCAPTPEAPATAAPAPGPRGSAPEPLSSLVVPPPPLPEPSLAGAAVAAASAVGGSGVTLGVAVLDRTTGEVAVDEEGTTPMRSASLSKVVTAVDVLVRRAAGEIPLDPADDDRIRRALGPSNDQAMSALWSTRDGPAGIGRVAAAYGLTDTTAPADSSQWGEVMISPRDAALLLGAVVDRLPPGDRDLLVDAMTAAPPTADDGFDQGFGLLDPGTRGTAVAKQGWLCCIGSTVDLHSVGLPEADGRYVVALLSNQPRGYDAARDVLDEAARAARGALTARR